MTYVSGFYKYFILSNLYKVLPLKSIMVNIDKDSLEKALKSSSASEVEAKEVESQISPEEEIGFHKGALNTLVAERNELFKMIQNVEAIMQAHVKRLEELGVKIDSSGKE